jgi:hypothetical protein
MEHGYEAPIWASEEPEWERQVERRADDLGKKIGKALGRIFRF